MNVDEGATLDKLQNMNGLEKKVVDKVQVQWLIKMIEVLLQIHEYLFHSDLYGCWTLRLFILLTLTNETYKNK